MRFAPTRIPLPVLLPAALLLLAACGDDSPSDTARPTVGTVVVDANPDALDAPWTLGGPDGFEHAGKGDATLETLAPGDYTLAWGDVADWTSPPDGVETLAAGATVTFAGDYTQGTGTVIVDVTPDALDAPWVVTGPNAVRRTGSGDATLTGLAAGDWTVAWGQVAGWTSPAGQTLALAADATVTFAGTFVEQGGGGGGGEGLIVVDHRAVVDFDEGNIPAQWIQAVKDQGILIHIPGRSHAQQLVGDLDDDTAPRHIGGLLTLAAMDPTYAVAVECDLADLPAAGSLRILKGQYSPANDQLLVTWECRYDGRQYWTMEAGRLLTEHTADHAAAAGDPIDASIYGWSYDIIMPGGSHDESGNPITFTDERRQAYLTAMDRFNQHPSGTVFVHATAPTDAGYDPPNYPPANYLTTDGLRVTLQNQGLRDGAAAAGGYLFDQADIENWNADFTARRIETYNGQPLQLRHQEWDGADCAHGGMGICVAKAKAVWWLAARLAGWDGTPAP